MIFSNSQIKAFLIFSIICSFLTVITTLGIHSDVFDFSDLNSKEKLMLFENPKYIISKFWIILHCLFILISMLGFLIIQVRKSLGFVILGFVFFSVFAFTEIFRQMFVLFYLNNLKRSLLITESLNIQAIIQKDMDHAGFIGLALFGLFIISFSLGNIMYGFSLLSKLKVDNILAILLLLWGMGNLLAFGNVFWENDNLGYFIEYFNVIYQPLMRLIVSLWMIVKFKNLFEGWRSNSLA